MPDPKPHGPTPTPWRFNADSGDIWGEDNTHVAWVVTDTDAALIVRAVNAHESLVEAATEALREMEDCQGWESEPQDCSLEVIERLRAVLAKARGEGDDHAH